MQIKHCAYVTSPTMLLLDIFDIKIQALIDHESLNTLLEVCGVDKRIEPNFYFNNNSVICVASLF